MTTSETLERAIDAHGLANAHDTILAAHTTGCPLSAACALLTMESGGRNIFGHDPTSSIPTSWKGGRVTRLRYLYYKARRGRYGFQGVGPTQLTSGGYQDAADRKGGCWKPLHNMEVGFSTILALHREFGSWPLAFQHFNGQGPAAVAYGKKADALRKTWHDRFEAVLR